MNDVSFDTLARDTQAPQGRRVALKALGLAALGAVAAVPLAADAKNNNGGNNKNKNNNGNKNRKQGRNQECPSEDCAAEVQQAAAGACQAQVATCEQEVRVICDRQSSNPEDLQGCLNGLLPCCASLGTCNITAFFACVAPPSDPNL